MAPTATPKYVVGCHVTYQPFCGEPRTVRVDAIEADIKNGEPGFDGTIIDGPDEGQTVWGYDDQIVSVRQEGEA